MPSVQERKYAMTKVKAGEYILPSNDGKTLWRITTYEDGPSHGLEDWPRDRVFWGIWKYHPTLNLETVIDLDDWTDWEFCSGQYNTRKEAIDAALGES